MTDDLNVYSVYRIVREAIAMIDRDGLDAVTMRSPGNRMGVVPMALYRHVYGREDLLEGIVESLVDEVEVGPEGGLDAEDGWQALLQWLAHSVRQIAVEHPAIFPLIATRHPTAPWLSHHQPYSRVAGGGPHR